MAQAEYVEDFLGAVVTFLAFHANYADLAERLARAVTDHATPVGSGTVGRTKRIPVEQRAEAAVIALKKPNPRSDFTSKASTLRVPSCLGTNRLESTKPRWLA